MPDTFTKRGSTRAITAEAAGLEELGRAALTGGAPVVRLMSVDPTMTALKTARLSPTSPTAHAAAEFGRRLARTHAFCPEGTRVFGQAPAGLRDTSAGLNQEPTGLNQEPTRLSEDLTQQDRTTNTRHIIAAMGDAPLPLVPMGSAARNWGEFYAEDRILPYLPDSLRNRSISPEGHRIIEQLCEKLRDGTFDSPQPKLVTADAALLHGDLWAGNIFWTHNTSDLHERVLMGNHETSHPSAAITSNRESKELLETQNISRAANNRQIANSQEGTDAVVAVLIDPASQGGHAESDLAQLTVFSAPFTERIYNSYHEVSPLADGWRERISLHQLHILIVHAALFGGSYGAQTISVARRYV